MIVQPTRTAHKTVVRSWTCAHTRVHVEAKHGPWLSIALFFVDLPRREAAHDLAPRSGDEARAASGAVLLAGPDGNHGENKSSTASTAQEVAR